MTPSVGRIVHYYVLDSPNAAIIVDVATDSAKAFVTLVVFGKGYWGDEPSSFVRDVPFSETPKINHWTWPPRVS